MLARWIQIAPVVFTHVVLTARVVCIGHIYVNVAVYDDSGGPRCRGHLAMERMPSLLLSMGNMAFWQLLVCAGRSYKFEEVKEAINECNRAGRGAKVFLEG